MATIHRIRSIRIERIRHSRSIFEKGTLLRIGKHKKDGGGGGVEVEDRHKNRYEENLRSHLTKAKSTSLQS